jgi:hypothetical protein
MQIAYCPNCGKNTEHKRSLGAGTILCTLLTGGLSLLAVPVYGKGCIICGLTIAEAMPQQSNENVTARDQIQGFLVLLGVVLLLVLIWRSAREPLKNSPIHSLSVYGVSRGEKASATTNSGGADGIREVRA